MEDLTPSQIVAELDKYIVGQAAAKRAVAIALRNRHRRRLLPEDLRDEVIPKNILMIGPTGVGKTEIARRLANLAHAPFIKVEATKFTEVGYVGRDVDSMVRDLAQVAVRMVENEKMAEVREAADDRAVERIVNILHPAPEKSSEPKDNAEIIRQTFGSLFGGVLSTTQPPPPEAQTDEDNRRRERDLRVRARLKEQVKAGLLDDQPVEIEVEQHPTPFLQVFSPQGMEEMGMDDLQSAFGNLMGRRRTKRTVPIREARRIFAEEEARNMLDHDAVVREAIARAEQNGIIFVDEIDKIAGREGGHGPDVSREGVQRDILPIIEGSTVATKYGPVRTNHILFIAAGAFHVSKPSDLIPELQGRLPIRVELEALNEADFRRILTEPRNALIRQYTALLATEGVTVEFTDDAIAEIASVAARVNQSSENIGARRLHTVMERLLEDVSFDAPDLEDKQVRIDAAYVRARLENIAGNEDLSRYIL
ncbi:MAG: ATP-dependent protease ATPase subunit HslU [Chthonomonadales bacterium]